MRQRFSVSLIAAIIALPALADGPKVSRLPGVPGQSPDILKETPPGGDPLINLTITRMHAPEIVRGTSIVARALRNDAVTPRVIRELVIMRVAQTIGSAYEINQHIPMIKACGYTQAKIDAVKDWNTSPLFDEKERAALAFTDQMVNGGDVDDPTFDKFASLYSSQEIVEIASTISNYVSTALQTKALKIELETDGRQAFLGKC